MIVSAAPLKYLDEENDLEVFSDELSGDGGGASFSYSMNSSHSVDSQKNRRINCFQNQNPLYQLFLDHNLFLEIGD
jgi:hypothetical protein